jgi:ectoine hydroxylase-related dioxygenase (phytanoyl-CoA dioxygenase family)
MSEPMTTAANLSEAAIAHYRDHGFVRIRGILTPEETARYHSAALDALPRLATHATSDIFHQFVNVWRQDATLRELVLHPNIAGVATRLAGTPLRLWHDQILIKQPGPSRPTEFHQDQPYWPHATSPNPISCWLALCDVPVERGCMSFLPGSHRRGDLPAQNLGDARSLFQICPDLEYEPRVTEPLRAGDCTFHHGRCAHMAGPNLTDQARVAQVIIYMERTTTYNGAAHCVTDPLGLAVGDALAGELFPDVGTP